MSTDVTYTARYTALIAQRAYARDVAARGVAALLEPYTVRVPVVPLQRRRVLGREKVTR